MLEMAAVLQPPDDILLDPSLLTFLAASGATVFPVTPYRYASDSETASVANAITKMASGEIDVIAITSSPQIRHLLEVVGEKGLKNELAAGWERTRVASVGPAVSDALKAIGVEVAAQPASGFHLKPLVTAIVRLYAP
jgi:uroporphyrinogen-III synthase